MKRPRLGWEGETSTIRMGGGRNVHDYDGRRVKRPRLGREEGETSTIRMGGRNVHD